MQIDLRSAAQIRKAYQQVNSQCTVPTLRTEEGTLFSDSAAIVAYLAALYPEPPLMLQSLPRMLTAVFAVLLQTVHRASGPSADATTLLTALGALEANGQNALTIALGVTLITAVGELAKRLVKSEAGHKQTFGAPRQLSDVWREADIQAAI